MKISLEQLLHCAAAAANLAAAFGLDPAIAMPLLAAISAGLAVIAEKPRS
jgi:phosphotransacetylase